MIHLLLIFLNLAAISSPTNTGPWVRLGPNGKLLYRADDKGNQIPDFSNCGYGGGGVMLPNVPVKATVNPVTGDAGQTIQKAIDEVAKLPPDKNGIRGAVLLKRGKYAIADSIKISTGGIVLRGEGDDENGTVLWATGTKQRSLIIIGAGGKSRFKPDEDAEDKPGEKQSGREIVDDYVPVGAHSFHVENVSGLKIGEEVIVHRPSTAEWIHTLKMDQIPMAKDGKTVQWAPGSKDLNFSRIITAIDGNLVTVDAPICCALEKQYGGGQLVTGVASEKMNQIGVENLRGDSEYKSPTDENHGWVFVELAEAQNAWVRNITSIHYGYSCVYVHNQCKWITVQDCQCLDPISQITGGRRYSFALDGQLTLVMRCSTRNGRHDFVMHALAAGPNVFLDCSAEQTHADSGPHHRWSVGTLYDNVKIIAGAGDDPEKSGGQINIRDRGNMGTGHGWAGANQVVWNCSAESMIIQSPPTAQNWAIGCSAKTHTGNGYWESPDQRITPASLYITQLEIRVGKKQADAVLAPPAKN